MNQTLPPRRTMFPAPDRAGQVAAWVLLAAVAPVMLVAGAAVLLAGPGEIIVRVPYLRWDGRLDYHSVFRTAARFEPERYDRGLERFEPVGAALRWLGWWRLPRLLDVGRGPTTPGGASATQPPARA